MLSTPLAERVYKNIYLIPTPTPRMTWALG